MSGNRIARRELWLWSLQLSSSQYATPFHAYYKRLRERNMPGMIAIGHVAGKLITVIFHCVRNGQQYNAAKHAADLGFVDDVWRRFESNKT
jgi:hypothetical protein